jgi:hypothetical protein
VPQTITRTNADGVTCETLVPAPPSPPPSPRTAPNSPVTIVVAIPTCTDPRTAALAVIKGLVPDVAGQTRGRSARAGEELSGLLERARLGREFSLLEFISHAARHIRLQRHLIDQVEALDGRPATRPPPLEAVIYGLAVEVGRFEDLSLLRGERKRLVELAAAELAEIEGRLKTHLPTTVHGAYGSDPNHPAHARGLVHSHDVWIRLYSDGFARRAVLIGTIARLGRDRTATGRDVADAIASAGAAKVCLALAPRMVVSPAAVERAQKTLDRLFGEMAEIDSRTQAWRALDGQRARADAELKAAERSVEQARSDAAAGMIARASTGDLGDILALEQLLAPTSGLRVALASCRGTPPELMATIAVLVEAADAFAESERRWKASMAGPQHQPIAGDFAGGAIAASQEATQDEYNRYVADDQAAHGVRA